MKVSFDSNVWEKIFADRTDPNYAPVRAGLADGRLEGFICEAAFKIEAITRKSRQAYFERPHSATRCAIAPGNDGTISLSISFGPDDEAHPGIPEIQAKKLQNALAAGVRLMRGLNWLGLPSPVELLDPSLFVQETAEEVDRRNQRQADMQAFIYELGVGDAKFRSLGGWSKAPVEVSEKKFAAACSEFADGELVIAHVAYQNDILCTEDRARNAGISIFSEQNRRLLAANYSVQFMTIEHLLRELGAR